MRTLRLSLEQGLQRKVQPDEVILTLLIDYAVGMFNIFKTRTDGMTPFEISKGCESAQPIAAFGEEISYHLPMRVAKTFDKSESQWANGTSLGFRLRSDEYNIGTRKAL